LRAETALPKLFFVFGIILVLIQHFAMLYDVPGLHFDEAWSANLAADLLAGGEWRSQSAYTRPWSQYLAAFFFGSFGVGLLEFRFLQVSLALAGLSMIGFSLFSAGFRRTALFLPLAASLLAGIATNHRFAIELTGLHPFCLGLFVLGIEQRIRLGTKGSAYFLIGAGTILGTTSHILFLAVPLATLAMLLLEEWRLERRDRLFLILVSLVLTPFFAEIALRVPEKGKGIALVCLGGAIFVWALLGAPLILSSQEWRSRLRLACLVLSIPFVFNAIAFADGAWSYLLTHGGLVVPFFTGLPAIAATLVVYRAWRVESLTGEGEHASHRLFFILLALISGLLMIKAAPRYFELPIIIFSVLLAHGISSLEPRRLGVFACFMSLLVNVNFFANYLWPARAGLSTEREIRLFSFRDSSRDFLPKQSLVRDLGARGCGMSDIKTQDSRVVEALTFLNRRDWAKVDGVDACPVLNLSRRVEFEKLDPSPEAEKIGDFMVWRQQ
jgi:hypothetical protein